MVLVCIYESNRGLGPCEGPVSRITVTSNKTMAYRGLRDLADRLVPSGEAPGVCQAHASRAEENGYLIGGEAASPPPRRRQSKSAGTPKTSRKQ